MTKREYEKLRMYNIVLGFFKKNADKFAQLPHITAAVALFRICVDTLYQHKGVQERSLKEKKKTANEYRRDLEKICWFIAMEIRSYASSIHDDDLFGLMTYTPSKFRLSRAKILVFDAENILATATAHLANLQGYGITQAIVDKLKLLITLFTNKINNTANQKKNKKTATQSVKKYVKEADRMLEIDIDSHMLHFEGTDLHTQYKIERRINKIPKYKQALQLRVIDADTKEAVQGALVQIEDHNINRKTSKNGRIIALHMAEGEHMIKVMLNGYIPSQKKVTYINGVTTKVVIEMEKG